METPSITDPNDPRLEPFRELVGRGRGPWVVVEGELAVERALSAGAPIEVVVAETARVSRLEAIADVPVLVADRAVLREVTGFDFHRGVLAAMRRPPMPSGLDPSFVQRARAKGRSTMLVAAGLADPANVGAVIRNARAFGVDLVVTDLHGADPLGRKAIRASAGTVFAQPLWLDAEVVDALAALRTDLGATIVAAAAHTGLALNDFARPDHLVLVVGNEGTGLDPEVVRVAEVSVHIPMVPGVDSLNVATATGILLWALTRPAASGE